MNIVESVVGCFVGLCCLFASRCEGVLCRVVTARLVYLLFFRDIYQSYIIFSYTSTVAKLYCFILGTHFLIHLPFHCDNIHKLVNILTLPGSHASTYWSQRESALALGLHFYIVSLVEGAGHYVTGVFVVFKFHLCNDYAL